jgi:hypothetical protein
MLVRQASTKMYIPTLHICAKLAPNVTQGQNKQRHVQLLLIMDVQIAVQVRINI